MVLPADVETISGGAFSNCKSLKSITYSGSVNADNSPIDLPETVKYIGSGAFYDCSSLAGQAKMPASLKEIGDNAFEKCSSLSGELRFSDQIESIGGSAFGDCTSLTKITILNPLCKTDGGFIFAGCTSLEEVTVPEVCKNYFYKFAGDSSAITPTLKKITILKGTEIPGDALNGFTSIETVVLPADVETINGGAFANCENLSCISYVDSLNAENTKIDFPPSLKYIGAYAFANCSSLEGNLTLSNGIERIEQDAFTGCSKLESFTIPEGVQKISGYGVGNWCDNLSTIIIPKSLTYVDECTFIGKINDDFGTVCYCGSEEEWDEITIREYNDSILRDKNPKLNIIFNYEAEEAESTVPGDANGDGVVGLSDALAILQYLANQMKYPLTEQQKINADVFLHGDSITGMDALTIQKYDAGLYDTLPVSYLGDE